MADDAMVEAESSSTSTFHEDANYIVSKIVDPNEYESGVSSSSASPASQLKPPPPPPEPILHDQSGYALTMKDNEFQPDHWSDEDTQTHMIDDILTEVADQNKKLSSPVSAGSLFGEHGMRGIKIIPSKRNHHIHP